MVHRAGMTRTTTPPTRLSEGQVRRIAADASVDPRTLHRLLRGEPVRGLAGERARAALEAVGIAIPEPREAA